MRHTVLAFVAFMFVAPAAALAQVDGPQLAGGIVLLTKAGKLTAGPSSVESDYGFAVRGRVWYGLGMFSVSGELQTSSQSYGATVTPGAPESLSATFVGVGGAVHPVNLLGVRPYGEVGLGKLFFSDDRVHEDVGLTPSLGLGAQIGVAPKLSVDVSLRLMRKSFSVQGLADEFKYHPKLFTVMVTLQL